MAGFGPQRGPWYRVLEPREFTQRAKPEVLKLVREIEGIEVG